eukprot:3467196-Pyramimonas_sp.AAC.1
MRVAATREDQCGLLDAASTIRVGLTQFMDDNAHRTSSRGGLAQALCKLGAASHSIRGQFRLGPGKTECMAQGLADRRPLNDIAFVDLHVSLGIPVEPDATMTGLLKQ